MDPISAIGFASAIVQILGALTSTVHSLDKLRGRFSDADFTIHALIQELSCIKTALTSLKELHRLNSSDVMVSEEFNEQMLTATSGCQIIMQVLSEDVMNMVHDSQSGDTLGFRSRIRVVWKEDIMKGHQEKLHAQVMALQLLLQVCQRLEPFLIPKGRTEAHRPLPSHTSQEQLRLLRQATTRRIMRKVRDDTETIISTRSQATSSAASISQHSSFTLGDSAVGFNDALADLSLYRRLSPQPAPSIGTSNIQIDTGEGFAYAPTRDRGSARASFDAHPPQQDYLLLPTSPSAPVHPAHRRAVSSREVPRPSLPNVTRSKSDTKAPKTIERSGSKLERISSLLRLNTSSRLNLASTSSNSSPKAGKITSFTRVKPKREQNPHTSIDLTGEDAASIPSIVKAAQAGSLGEVARLIDYGMKIEERHKKSGRNALLVAAHCGKDDIVELLIQHHARIDVVDGSGWTALHLAASRGHCDVITLLLEESNISEIPNYQGRTALRVAVDRSQHEAVQKLLMYNAKVNTRAENQMSTLHIAAKQGDAEIVNMLASNGADIEAKDANMMSALHYACERGHVEVIAVLLAHKANIEAIGRDRKTPLICAAESGQSRAVEFLLKSKQKASASGTDDTGMTALHWAAYNGHEETVDILSQKKGSLARVNAMGRTALHLSVMQTQFAVVEPLLRKGADLNSRCATGLTPLHYACMADSIELAMLLLQQGADIEATEYQHQQRPLHVAAARSSIHLLELLCTKGASLDARDSVGDWPLSVACRCGHVAAVGKLLSLGSPLYQEQQATSRSDSPLCLAAMGGHLPVVSLLLERGASASRKDEGGWQPFRHAAYHGHVEVLKVLLAHTRIPDTEVSDVISMPETIGFHPDFMITEDRKVQVRELLNQALAESGQMPPTRISKMALTVNNGNHPAQSSQDRYSQDCESLVPQELPATLEQGLPSSRSATPERDLRAEITRPNDREHVQLRLSEQPSPPVNANSASVPNDPRGISPIRYTEQNSARQNPRRHPAREEPPVSATFVPQQRLVFTPPRPQKHLKIPSHSVGIGVSVAESMPVQSRRYAQRSRIPQRTPAPREIVLPISKPEPPVEHMQEAIDDSLDSDTDSMCSVYTAPDGSVDTDIASGIDYQNAPFELAA
ncbi:unnamed protein product [Penicillium olsonii]|nr:unnamed protein product [Penicillium olsonii]